MRYQTLLNVRELWLVNQGHGIQSQPKDTWERLQQVTRIQWVGRLTEGSSHSQEGNLVNDRAPPHRTIVGQPGPLPHHTVHPRFLHYATTPGSTQGFPHDGEKTKQIGAGEKKRQWPTHLPPSRSIRSFSLGSSGLWSWVTSRACSAMSESFSFTPTTTAESPTWATYILTPRMMMTLAVVPDVLGRPVMVLGHSAVGRGGHKGEKISVKCWW